MTDGSAFTHLRCISAPILAGSEGGQSQHDKDIPEIFSIEMSKKSIGAVLSRAEVIFNRWTRLLSKCGQGR